MDSKRPDMTRPPRIAWDRVAGVYHQCLSALYPESEHLSSAIPAFLAELIARVSASYHAEEATFVDDFWDVVLRTRHELGIPENSRADIYRDQLFLSNALYSTRRGKNSPSPVEATIETIRRLRDFREVEAALSKKVLAGLLGGSTSYGRFLNVRGGGGASDLDLLAVVGSFGDLRDLLEALRTMPGVSARDIEKALSRASEFQQFQQGSPKPCVFSAKLALWEGAEDPLLEDCGVASTYLLSVHVLSRNGLGQLLLEGHPQISSKFIGTEAEISDYREEPPKRLDFQRSFSGNSKRMEMNYEKHENSFVRATKIFVIDTESDSYYPGMFQNLVLPTFDVRWGDAGCRRLVDSFRWKMIDRLRFEHRERPNELLRLSWAHTRSDVFAPHIARSVDSSTVLG